LKEKCKLDQGGKYLFNREPAEIVPFEKELENVLKSHLNELLRLWKQVHDYPVDQLVFIGMADVASYKWCAMKSVFKNRESEPEFFGAFIHDRVFYSYLLGKIDKVPLNPEDILAIGDDVTPSEVEQIFSVLATTFLRRWIKFLKNVKLSDEEKRYLQLNYENLNAENMIKLNEILRKNIKIKLRFKDEVIDVKDIDSLGLHPYQLGQIIETLKAEKYPRIRWNFKWHNYIILGVPDGMTRDMVYEFKTTKSNFLLSYIKPVAETQADLYGFFFKRPIKRVQIYVRETEKISTWQGPVDNNNAIDVLKSFEITEKEGQAIPPVPWKCKKCSYRNICPII